MDVKCVAEEAIEIFTGWKDRFGYTKREYAALIGFLKGVAGGNITTGQSWPVRLLLFERAVNGVDVIIVNDIDSNESEILEKLFASGMLCEGQDLNLISEKNVSQRIARKQR